MYVCVCVCVCVFVCVCVCVCVCTILFTMSGKYLIKLNTCVGQSFKLVIESNRESTNILKA
jgi:hypothetical protein